MNCLTNCLSECMGNHALLSPSSAHRWLHCAAAPRLEEHIEDRGSVFAEEGTLAHAYCALKLKEFLGLPTDGELEEIGMLEGKYHCGEMDEHTDTYKVIVLEKLTAARSRTADAQLLVETRLDFGNRVPEAFGTADAIVIADGCMEVIDFKYGKGVKVSAVSNPQMMIYALGAYDKFSFDYRIERVRMTIVQPRIDNLSEWELSADELLGWSDEVLVPAARAAFEGGGEQCPGEWCRFCKVKHSCRALADRCLKLAADHAGRVMSSEELARDVLPQVATVKAWLAGVEDYALELALGGTELPGWKLVEGRSVRKIQDAGGAAAALQRAGYREEEIYRPLELRTISELEKLTGRKLFENLCGEYVARPKGKPTLVPASDKRAAINPMLDDFKDL
ncbi:MAG: DUF2800 domain-containing protein [Alloprevotella sp.]